MAKQRSSMKQNVTTTGRKKSKAHIVPATDILPSKSRKLVVANDSNVDNNELLEGKGSRQQKVNRHNEQEETCSNDDWMSALVKQNVKIDSNNSNIPELQISKAERIRRRQSKKQVREEGSSKKRKRKEHAEISTSTHKSEKEERKKSEVKQIESLKISKNQALQNQKMERLEQHVEDILKCSLTPQNHNNSFSVLNDSTKGEEIGGKAVHGRGAGLTQTLLIPRNSDYGGCGLARSSLYIDLFDPSFIPKIEEEFAEHIEGFKTKKISKSMKKQLDSNMLWRQIQRSKEETTFQNQANSKAQQQGRAGKDKKLNDLNPDDRVEAMIKLGLI